MTGELLRSSEVAALLQYHLKTVQRMARSGAIPAARVGGEWRFSRAELERWLGTRPSATSAPAAPPPPRPTGPPEPAGSIELRLRYAEGHDWELGCRIARELLDLVRSAPVHHSYRCPALGPVEQAGPCSCGAGLFAIRRRRMLGGER